MSFLFLDGINPTWRLGRIVKIEGSRITIDYRNITKDSDTSSLFVERSPRDVKILFHENEVAVNSVQYFNNLLSNIIEFQGDNDQIITDPCREASQGKKSSQSS